MEIISQPIQTAWRNKRAKAETTPGCATGTARSLGLANRRGFTVSRGGSGPIAKSAARSSPARVQLVLLGTTVPSILSPCPIGSLPLGESVEPFEYELG